ncbi:LysM peptidoglycan-binding domain-containing protein [Cellulomonas sp.]|uniref:LysM peptidoglycan-binding domain-containing protein n=1 Tax=Cellulomonas sp. TaxID=40001 RepID=UPI003BABD062
MSAMVMGPAMPNLVPARVPGRVTSIRVAATRQATARAERAAVPSARHLRLTARGRAVLWALAAVVIAVITLLGTQAAADGPTAAQEVVRHVVAPGETLWQIAESIAAPTDDVRDVVFDLVRLNELPDAGLMAGQVIVLPAD